MDTHINEYNYEYNDKWRTRNPFRPYNKLFCSNQETINDEWKKLKQSY